MKKEIRATTKNTKTKAKIAALVGTVMMSMAVPFAADKENLSAHSEWRP